MLADGYTPVCLRDIEMLASELIQKQIDALKEVIAKLERLKEDVEPMKLDEAEELWDSIDIDTLKNAHNFGDFMEIVRRVSAYYSIGVKR
jgi:ribosome-binding ATPase YchF (GTP1/OBG family)